MFDIKLLEKTHNYLSINEDLINARRYDEIYYGVKDEEKRYVTYFFKGAGLLDDVIDNLGTLYNGMFRDYDIPEKFDLPKKFVINGQKHILSGAFAGNSTIEEIVFEDDHPDYVSIDGNVYSKDKKTFIQYAPAKKEESFVVPDFVETIDKWAFNENSFLKKVDISNNVKWIFDFAFENCTSLTEIKLPRDLKYLNNAAFKNCTSLKTISLPRTIEKIDRAFENCTSLENIKLY